MIIELTKEVALDLLTGISAPCELFSHDLIKDCFDYSEPYGVFKWKSKIKDFDVKILYEMYKLCKTV